MKRGSKKLMYLRCSAHIRVDVCVTAYSTRFYFRSDVATFVLSNTYTLILTILTESVLLAISSSSSFRYGSENKMTHEAWSQETNVLATFYKYSC